MVLRMVHLRRRGLFLFKARDFLRQKHFVQRCRTLVKFIHVSSVMRPGLSIANGAVEKVTLYVQVVGEPVSIRVRFVLGATEGECKTATTAKLLDLSLVANARDSPI